MANQSEGSSDGAAESLPEDPGDSCPEGTRPEASRSREEPTEADRTSHQEFDSSIEFVDADVVSLQPVEPEVMQGHSDRG